MKTKAILSSLLVCIVTTLSAQINLNDSTVQVVAYWSKGDVTIICTIITNTTYRAKTPYRGKEPYPR